MERINFILYIILITIAIYMIIRGSTSCPVCYKEIEYRYVPRTKKELIYEPIDLTGVYENIFTEDSLI
jgi:hypothetical protein